ncbi:hypothetical protein OROMI_028466 [Orobanche minor]
MAAAPIRLASIRKRAVGEDDESIVPFKLRATTFGDLKRAFGMDGGMMIIHKKIGVYVPQESVPVHILFECASGYALFLAPGIDQVEKDKFQAVEEFISRSPFELVDVERFSSAAEALVELNAISKSTLTHKLKHFLQRNLPDPRKNRYYLANSDPNLGELIIRATRLPVTSSIFINNVTRGLRDKIHTFLGLDHGELEKAQVNLARLYSSRTSTQSDTTSPDFGSSSSYLQEQVEVVPHRFEGFFYIKGKENVLCTRNLVPGEALYGEILVRVQLFIISQNEDRTEVEYRVWDMLRSKLGAAILGGITNIWIKPGSRVLYAGNVCALTISILSDIVGLDGLVYVMVYSNGDDGDDAVHMARTRENVATITVKSPYRHWHYRMLLGMVDVLFGEVDHCPDHPQHQPQVCWEVKTIANNARFYLRAGGHYIIFRQVDNNSIGRAKDPFTPYNTRNEFTSIETVMLDGGYSVSVGGYRI